MSRLTKGLFSSDERVSLLRKELFGDKLKHFGKLLNIRFPNMALKALAELGISHFAQGVLIKNRDLFEFSFDGFDMDCFSFALNGSAIGLVEINNNPVIACKELAADIAAIVSGIALRQETDLVICSNCGGKPGDVSREYYCPGCGGADTWKLKDPITSGMAPIPSSFLNLLNVHEIQLVDAQRPHHTEEPEYCAKCRKVLDNLYTGIDIIYYDPQKGWVVEASAKGLHFTVCRDCSKELEGTHNTGWVT
ncbi:hypothetical protein A3K34_02460 [candidate division WWE3 bacterium RIFOXYC1_FULL_40_10]|uniref:Uncharacterized protein n=1 Tax=candidate division WWE3 bacterium RIFOXYA2_FULL_46_9 TaxID=1802636 RepID=A0A1F4W2Q8_UNCKA|nr:MAG: hypothetical protein A3K58_02460 [candidate division WWE3 bacterium RIFOXYB1_FULL_40_22]OGC61713.1 MAG: hypothetical protein A3K37_02460 [candidate division WWE3 bacterium RIFOXYA1_FULL_40_11]OGC63697.1 MAG: hypothetical protein A2264_04950 [candidate division WWE3 bacterium RIFOXYA2_FULL_46_9]OGC64887.1 MAG: hypothetical protein A2326_01285 [candidate division WWE3 bacterium RIFOXYB2_FULL_41_6]OGC66096.1 MAG: hypothetical protein A3K34_02460 [candidate division WWE3 bacterium RIFOXYC1_